jgi:hypothetical protein
LKDPYGVDHITMDARKNSIAGSLINTFDSTSPVPIDADLTIATYLIMDGPDLANQRAVGMASAMEGGGSTSLSNGRYTRSSDGSWSRLAALATDVNVTQDLHGAISVIGGAGPSNVTDGSSPTGPRYGSAAMRWVRASNKLSGGASSSLFKSIESFVFGTGLVDAPIKLRLAVFQPLGTAGVVSFKMTTSGFHFQPGNLP